MRAQALKENIEVRGRELANKHSLAELATMVADCAPDHRNKWSVETRIPWSLIFAIRQRRIMEDDAAERADGGET